MGPHPLASSYLPLPGERPQQAGRLGAAPAGGAEGKPAGPAVVWGWGDAPVTGEGQRSSLQPWAIIHLPRGFHLEGQSHPAPGEARKLAWVDKRGSLAELVVCATEMCWKVPCAKGASPSLGPRTPQRLGVECGSWGLGGEGPGGDHMGWADQETGR